MIRDLKRERAIALAMQEEQALRPQRIRTHQHSHARSMIDSLGWIKRKEEELRAEKERADLLLAQHPPGEVGDEFD